MDSARFLSDEAWLEEHFGAAETFTADSNNVPIWKFICFFLVRAFSGSFHFGVKIQCNVAQLLFHIPHNLALGGCCEGIAALRKDFHQLFCEVPACKIKSKDGMR